MSTTFAAKKAKILQQLAVPDASSTDIQPGDCVDVGIRELVDEINKLDTLATTSSCAGRFAVYLEGKDPNLSQSSLDEGDGQWLFISHDPLPLSGNGSVAPMLGLSDHTELSVPSSAKGVRWVRCKFEPMFLHVLSSSLESAQKIHTAALQSGFRESGISSISTDNLRTSTAMVAIRTNDIVFDNIIGYEGPDGRLIPMVTEAYMRILIELGNQKFQANKARTQQFQNALLTSFGPPQAQYSGPCAWEPIEQRRVRMREDDIRRKADAQRTTEDSARSSQ
ncbi:hypothetical protein D6D15_09698 [Aureobasidium pullulans]|uniref:tRNA(Phe) 7-[(3-amino-3-carboxypropyl)-4-demethylwyosine(37)-N(4)]-methyltransferase n=1 Tax=Aureobasidium pullulans TaxID=5580 RepID=A0A4S9AT85_AURPU|nr:hypothetical protein D6D15_09698 [Aureobasidium pullulans]